jgi:hypothetical protein
MLNLGGQLNDHRVVLRPQNPISQTIPLPFNCPPVRTWQSPPFATRSSDTKLPKALVYHDSFMTMMQPYLSEHFATAIYIRDLFVNLETVKDYHPDIIVHECLERLLRHFIYVEDDLRRPQPTRAIAVLNQPAGEARK